MRYRYYIMMSPLYFGARSHLIESLPYNPIRREEIALMIERFCFATKGREAIRMLDGKGQGRRREDSEGDMLGLVGC